MAKILVIRFSAMGDVLMTVPVLSAFATQYPQHEIMVLSRKRMAVYFQSLPDNVRFKGVDLNEYKGLGGLHRLYQELETEKFDAIADFHDVLRSMVIRWQFALHGTKVAHIHKGRAEKKALTHPGTEKKQLKTSFQRYAEVMNQLGFPFTLTPPVETRKRRLDDGNRIGIAPFAAHVGKIYPLEKMKQVVQALANNPKNQVLLFGGGKKEQEILGAWEKEIPGVQSMVGKLQQKEELDTIQNLDVMVTMDSANMHLASLVGTPVLSIWGATHPYAGFLGWGQSSENVIQVDLPCRPCSIYGNKPCTQGNYPCLNQITPEQIVNRIETFLQ